MLLDRLDAVAHWLGRAAAIVAGYALLGLSIMICAEIVMRRFIGVSLQGVDEIGGYVLAGASAFGFAYALLQRGHTRIDLVLQRVSAGPQAVLNVLAAVVIAAIAIFMAWRAHATFARSLELGSLAATPLQTPIWMPQLIWLSGLVFFAVVAVFFAFKALAAVPRGAAAVNEVSGTPSLSAEIDAELRRDE
jgi:TRAP-type C4-dicarboxylate transport system permease small subunit